MSNMDNAPRRRVDQPWSIVTDLASVDLDERIEETGPMPAASPQPPSQGASDGVKYGIGGLSVATVLALVDKALSGSGMTMTDLVEHLGPVLGVIYVASPVMLIVVIVGMLVLRGYRQEQDTHRRRDKRLQSAFAQSAHAIKLELGGLREDVTKFTTNFTAALENVKSDVEAKIGAAVRAASQVAGDRADQTDKAIADIRGGLADLRTRMVMVESMIGAVEPRDPRLHPVPPHTTLEPVPQVVRRPRRGG